MNYKTDIIHPVLPGVFPEPFACDWGEDEYGIWMGFRYKGIRQGMRWIAPGEFFMGSPEEEAERYDDEMQHRVVLTRGFWLADTACTQELWEAVMGDNPSRFTGGKGLPVDSVSWKDCRRFLDAINRDIPGLGLVLPTEAQWEYACRSKEEIRTGNHTPFSFGHNITPEQVNYNGKYPYKDGKKGIYREKTVPAGFLPPNDRGLCEMHGNLREWCNDWYGDYGTDDVVDPAGPDSGTDRVLRGGSWITDARNVRSAHRLRREPGHRNVYIGFRFSRGQTGSGG